MTLHTSLLDKMTIKMFQDDKRGTVSYDIAKQIRGTKRHLIYQLNILLVSSLFRAKT